MFSHIVLYKTNPANPAAAAQIVATANQLLKHILSSRCFVFHASRIPPSTRMVGGNEFQVALNFIFEGPEIYEAYMEHPLHLDFVRFVLRGWMIKGSTADDPEAAFINHILKAQPDDPVLEWVRNPAIPEQDIVWAGEMVIDAYGD